MRKGGPLLVDDVGACVREADEAGIRCLAVLCGGIVYKCHVEAVRNSRLNVISAEMGGIYILNGGSLFRDVLTLCLI